MMRHLSILVIATLLVSCGRYGRPDRSIKREVLASEVVGTWIIRNDSLDLFKRDGYIPEASAKHQIIFLQDGSMTFDSAYSNVDGVIEHATAEGRWSLKPDSNGSTTLEMHIMIRGGHHIDSFSFSDEGGEIRLWQYHGDPDMWEFLEYSKK